MATYVEIVKNEFPEIDSEVFAYITGESAGMEGNSEQNWAAGPRNINHQGTSVLIQTGFSSGANGLTLRLPVDEDNVFLLAESGSKVH